MIGSLANQQAGNRQPSKLVLDKLAGNCNLQGQYQWVYDMGLG